MSLFTDIKNAFTYLAHGNFQEFILRVKVYTGYIDLKTDPPDSAPTDHTHPYSNSSGFSLQKVLDKLEISTEDAVVDFGSGKGGALITFSRYPFSKIAGVEISHDLAKISRENLKKLGINNVEIFVEDASHFTLLDNFNFFYFFNPFPGNVVRDVIQNIEASLRRSPRHATIIYFNPEYHYDVINNSSFLKVSEFHYHPLGSYIYSNIRG